MPSKIRDNVVELNKIQYIQGNNSLNFTATPISGGAPIVDATAGVYANGAFIQANSAFAAANNVAPQIQPAFDKANAAFNAANSAVHRESFIANNAQTLFQTNGYNIGYVDVFVNGIKLYTDDFVANNGVSITVVDPILEQNDHVEIINWGGNATPIAREDSYARNLSNVAFTTSNTAIINANLSYIHANASYNVANTLASNIYSAVITANLSYNHANEAYNIANTLVSTSIDNFARSWANSAFAQANAAFQSANNVAPQVQPAFNKANSAVFYDANTSNTGFLAIPNGTTAQRPASPANGVIRLNTTTNNLEIYAGQWMNVFYTGTIVATGGTIVYNGNFKIHIFTGSGSFNVTQASPGATVELLVVGGGGGSTGYAGGAGGGGVIYEAQCPVVTTSYPVTVGAGGTGTIDNGNSYGGVGGSSNAFSQVVLGGGGGRGADATGPAPTCANGGGGGSRTAGYSGTAPTPVRLGVAYGGRTGGNGTEAPAYPGGGGAGAANNGSNQTGGTQGGPGGNGVLVDILGPSYYWAGGGGAMVYYAAQGNGGNGGLGGGGGGYDGGTGGAGYNPGGTAVASGVAGNRGGEGGTNTGGGAGGSGGEGGPANPMPNGGSGVVIIKYRYQ